MCRPQRPLWGQAAHLELDRATSRLILGPSWLVTECWGESVYSPGRPSLGQGAFCILTLSAPLGLDRTMAREPP